MANGNSFQPEFFEVPDSRPNEMQNFINMTTSYMGDQVRAEQAQQNQLMQSLANNNRLHAAAEGDEGSFQYGGQWMKMGPKPVTGTDMYNEKRAKYFGESQAMDTYTKVYASIVQDSGDIEAASTAATRAYEDVLKSFGPSTPAPGAVVTPEEQAAADKDYQSLLKKRQEAFKPVKKFNERVGKSITSLTEASNKSLEMAGKEKMPAPAMPKVQAPVQYAEQDLELFKKYSTDKGVRQKEFDTRMADVARKAKSSGYTREQIIKQFKSRGFKDPEKFVDLSLKGLE